MSKLDWITLDSLREDVLLDDFDSLSKWGVGLGKADYLNLAARRFKVMES